MPNDDRLDWENVAHIHHRILCSNQKWWVCVICRDMDESGEHHPQQTDTRTENENRIFSLIGGWWTMRKHGHREGNTTHWGLLGGIGEGQQVGELWRYSLKRNARCGWRGGRQQITLPRLYLCNYLACSAHVPQSLTCNLKKKKLLLLYEGLTGEVWWEDKEGQLEDDYHLGNLQ